MKFSEYAAHAVVCSAGLSYMLEPDLAETQLQIVERTFISFHHAPLILTAYAARMSVVQVSRILHQALKGRRGLRARLSEQQHSLKFFFVTSRRCRAECSSYYI